MAAEDVALLFFLVFFLFFFALAFRGGFSHELFEGHVITFFVGVALGLQHLDQQNPNFLKK